MAKADRQGCDLRRADNRQASAKLSRRVANSPQRTPSRHSDNVRAENVLTLALSSAWKTSPSESDAQRTSLVCANTLLYCTMAGEATRNGERVTGGGKHGEQERHPPSPASHQYFHEVILVIADLHVGSSGEG